MGTVNEGLALQDGEDASVAGEGRKAAEYTGLACLGLVRFVLASGVMLFHLWTPVAPDLGRYSVIGFFCISGFLITKIARENYAGRPWAFLANRFLRIYPTYLFALCLALLIISRFPDVAAGGFLHVVLPASPGGWLTQFAIFGLVPYDILSPAWTLGIELYFYLIIGLVTYRSQMLTLACFCVSMVVTLLSIFHRIELQFYFSTLADASVFFAGSVAYFMSRKWNLPPATFGLACLGYALCALVLPRLVTLSDYAGPVPNLFLLASLFMAFMMLAGEKSARIHRGALTGISYYTGRLAYPMFLLHWSIAMPFSVVLGERNAKVFLASYLATLLVSAVVVQCIDLPVERLRKRVRGREPVRDKNRNIQSVL